MNRPYPETNTCGYCKNRPRPPHEVKLGSDEDARELAALMLDERPTYPCAEVWDRGRLVCIVRRGE